MRVKLERKGKNSFTEEREILSLDNSFRRIEFVEKNSEKTNYSIEIWEDLDEKRFLVYGWTEVIPGEMTIPYLFDGEDLEDIEISVKKDSTCEEWEPLKVIVGK